ncbi:c-type cytochrome [Olivibacter sitiensis]|uniref:c-type cytochrome n=1 Tax=Olivibacter sitiensis TaxID=376470 RepID=UPI0004084894|nr:c-type cytochrome [Olivibacter sitiensis]
MIKKLKVVGGIALILLLLVLLASLYIGVTKPNVGAADEINIAITAQRIQRGEYLANHVTVCMDCHSKRDWSLYSAPMMPNTLGEGGELFDQKAGFPGKIYATNITPHALAGWTDGELLRAISTGVNKDGRALFPIMGYARFGQMDKEDIYSIIAYLRKLSPVKNEVPETVLDFPVNLLNRLSPQKASFQERPPVTDSIRYGGYLVNAAGCVDCHSKTDKGKIVPGSEFGGGMEFKQPGGIIRSTNITPHKTNGIGGWTKKMFVQRFKQYADSGYAMAKLAPNQLNTPMPWKMYAGMTEQDLESVYSYLLSLAPNANPVVKISKK